MPQGVGFDPYSIALFPRFTTPPTDARKVLINNFFVALRAAGILGPTPKLDCLWVMAAADAQAAQRNWIADAFNLTPTSGPTFAADRGYTGGSSSYLDTGFNPSAAAGHFAQNSAAAFAWSRKSGTDGGTILGTLNGITISIFPRFSDGVAYARLNDGADITKAAIGDGSGLTHVNRSASNAKQLYKNGASVATASTASTGLVNENVTLLRGSLSFFFSGEVALAGVGSSLTSGDALALYNAANAYLTAVGAA